MDFPGIHGFHRADLEVTKALRWLRVRWDEYGSGDGVYISFSVKSSSPMAHIAVWALTSR